MYYSPLAKFIIPMYSPPLVSVDVTDATGPETTDTVLANWSN